VSGHLKRSEGLGKQIAGDVAAGDTVLCGDGFQLLQLGFRQPQGEASCLLRSGDWGGDNNR